MRVATEILNQLGGNKFVVMTGAKNLGATDNSLSMRLPRNASGANYLKITLNSMDLYDVEFLSIRGMKVTPKKEFNNAYNDMLVSLFEKTTGLYTKF